MIVASPQPLRGIRVVEFGHWMAGPAVGMLLADNGADVVHVEPPGGPRWAPQADENLNRGKRRDRLDLGDPADVGQAKQLIGSADVVIENFRPGMMARYGLDYDSVRTGHPGLVYLTLPGFASTDLDHQNQPAYEGVIASATGQFADMGVNRVLMGIEASYSPLPLGSTYAAVFGALAVTLALRTRLRHGVGDHIEVPIASSLLEGLAYNAMHVEDLPARYLSRRETEIARRQRHGLAMDLDYPQVQQLLDPFYRTYRCSDGRPFYIVAVAHRGHVRRVLEVLDIWDEAVEAGLPLIDPYRSTRTWPPGADCTLYAHPISDTWSDWLSARIAAALDTRPMREWEQIFAEHGIPAAGQRTTAEWITSEHALKSGLIVETDHPRTGRTRRMGPVVWLEDPQPGTVPQPTPLPPHDPSAGWADDLTVVDLTNVIAGPTIGSTLARFGARVTKIDPPNPAFDPWNTILCGLHANRGKESILLDARTPDGRSALHKLLANADVVTVNASGRQLAALGLTADNLAAIAPNAVLCHLDAWSGPAGGPWSDRPGYDDLVQAATGIMARFGGGLSTPEEHAHFGTIDVLAGLCGALATAMALYARDATGRKFVARTSLAAAGQLIQAPFLYDHADRGPWDEPAGREARGEDATYGLYHAADGWMFAVITDPTAVLGPGVDEPSDDELRAALAHAFAAHTVEEWRHKLAPQAVAVQPLHSLTRLRTTHTTTAGSAPWSTDSFRFLRTADHAAGRPVTLVAPIAIRPRQATITVPHDAPRYGQHTRRILSEIGYDATEIDALLRSGVAGEAWSPDYLPD